MSSELEKLTFTLRKIKMVSVSILNAMLIIMERIDEDNSEIIDEIKYACPDANVEDINKYLQDLTLTIIKDPEIIIEEINNFFKVAAKGNKVIKRTFDKYPFLANVWSGDMYDGKEGVEALQELLKELNETKENATESYVVDTTIEHFSNEED